MQQQNSQISDLQRLITEWKLNKGVLASKCEINPYTFKMKLLERPNYTFTEAEIDKLKEVLKDLVQDIEPIAGLTFNNALKKLVSK